MFLVLFLSFSFFFSVFSFFFSAFSFFLVLFFFFVLFLCCLKFFGGVLEGFWIWTECCLFGDDMVLWICVFSV